MLLKQNEKAKADTLPLPITLINNPQQIRACSSALRIMTPGIKHRIKHTKNYLLLFFSSSYHQSLKCIFLLDQKEKEFKDQFCVRLAF